MDVSDILASQAAKHKSVTVEKDIPLEVDAGFLTVTDLNPIDKESYDENLEEYLQSTARDGVQVLLTSLFTLPTQSTPDGPIAQLPAPTTLLPRQKPLPKPKPPTKWEQFARAKGISHKKKDKKEWDEEKQEWVNRWGWGGKNKQVETQWLTEVPANADIEHDPSKEARDARKARVAKNEKQHLQNLARAQSSGDRSARKQENERVLATTRVSTASMGKFDKKLEGEKKLRGMKRKFDPTETSVESEKKSNLALLGKLDSESKRARKTGGGDDTLNVRKAVRFASKGQGGVSLARKAGGGG
ncbi:RRS1-domain-containing protein, partial [Dentipellis sp. KUC8613]